MYTTTVHMSGS